jgi:hypothetical protein
LIPKTVPVQGLVVREPERHGGAVDEVSDLDLLAVDDILVVSVEGHERPILVGHNDRLRGARRPPQTGNLDPGRTLRHQRILPDLEG